MSVFALKELEVTEELLELYDHFCQGWIRTMGRLGEHSRLRPVEQVKLVGTNLEVYLVSGYLFRSKIVYSLQHKGRPTCKTFQFPNQNVCLVFKNETIYLVPNVLPEPLQNA